MSLVVLWVLMGGQYSGSGSSGGEAAQIGVGVSVCVETVGSTYVEGSSVECTSVETVVHIGQCGDSGLPLTRAATTSCGQQLAPTLVVAPSLHLTSPHWRRHPRSNSLRHFTDRPTNQSTSQLTKQQLTSQITT